MNSSFKIGRIRGIEIGVHPTWLIAFALFAWVFASSYYPNTFEEWTTRQHWIAGIATSLALFASVLVHELAHSITAQKLGLQVIGITLFIFGGVSQITGRYSRARDEFLVAFAGPASSIALGGLLVLAWLVVRPDATVDVHPLLGILFYIGSMNIVLGIFNLLPGFPLDGGRVLRSIVWGWTGSESKAMRVAVTVGRLIAWAIIGLGAWRFMQGDYVNGAWIAFIGLFLSTAARNEEHAERARTHAGHVPLRVAVRRTPQFVDASTRVSEVMEGIIGRGFQDVVPVTDRGEPVGFFSPEDAHRFPEPEWRNLSAGSVIPREPLWAVQLSADATDVLEELHRRRVRYALVLAGDSVVGVVDRPGLEAAIRWFMSSGGDASADQTPV